MSTGIFLGANEIKYNGSPVGLMSVGGVNICKAYVGSTQVFDNCAQANTNVQLQYTGSYGGNASGVIVENPLNNLLLSGQPGNTGTLTLYTPTYPGSGYTCTGGCPDVNPKSIAYTFPASGTTIINSARSGGLNSNVPTYTDTITVVKSNPPLTTGTAGGSGTYGPFTSGTSYNVPVTFTPATGYSYTLTAADGSSTINLSLNSGTGNYEGTLSRTMGGSNGSATITITGTQTANQTAHEFQFTTNLTNATATYNVANTSATTSGNAPANITVTEPYGTNLTPSLTVTTDTGYNPPVGGYTFSATNNQAIQVGVTSSPTIVSVSGTATIAYTAVTFYTATGGCANDACINYASGATKTLYYGASGPGSGLYENTGLTTPISSSNYQGYHAIVGGSSINISGVNGTIQSCVSGSLTQFSNTTYASTAISACSGSLADVYYGDGGLLTTSTKIYIGNTGCTPTAIGWVSDGTDAVQIGAGGNVISTYSC